MTPRRGSYMLLGAALLLAPSLAPAQGQDELRRELEAFARVLEQAVRKVSRAGAVQIPGAGGACRGYRVEGYGVVFVLAPRALPAQNRVLILGDRPGREEATLAQVVRELEQSLARVQSEEVRSQLERSLQALRAEQQRVRDEQRRLEREARQQRARAEREAHRAAKEKQKERQAEVWAETEAELEALEEQVRAIQREAEKAREEAERALEKLSLELRLRLGASPSLVAAAPEAPPAPPAPAVEAPPPPEPPWRFWFETEDLGEARTSERIVADVRDAVAEALESRGASLRLLRPEEFVVVAVDFLPRGAFAARRQPERTLIVRVRKKDLEERQAGTLGPEAFRRKVESVEY